MRDPEVELSTPVPRYEVADALVHPDGQRTAHYRPALWDNEQNRVALTFTVADVARLNAGGSVPIVWDEAGTDISRVRETTWTGEPFEEFPEDPPDENGRFELVELVELTDDFFYGRTEGVRRIAILDHWGGPDEPRHVTFRFEPGDVDRLNDGNLLILPWEPIGNWVPAPDTRPKGVAA